MANLHIYKYGAPILRKKALEVKKITPELVKTLEDMGQTMYEAQGAGLAAVQVGVNKRILVIDVGDGLWQLINPRIIAKRGKALSTEGCLSLPGLTVKLERAQEVTVETLNKKGKKIIIEAQALFAYALQHEIDHLNGVLIIDYLDRKKRRKTEEGLKKWLEKTPKM